MTDTWAHFRNSGAALLCLLALPLVAHAQTSDLRAGFAPGSIWLSRNHVTAGESVNILTVLYNSSDRAIRGDVVIQVDGSSVGTKGFSLTSGESEVVSLPWTATTGSHSISAKIEKAFDANSKAASISNALAENITISISEPPTPSPSSQIVQTVVSAVQTGVAAGTPAVLNAANTLFSATEALRADAKTALENQLGLNAQTPAGGAKTGGGGASVVATTSSALSSNSMISNALRYAAAAGLAVVSSQTLFYVSLVLVVLLLIQIVRVSLRDRRRKGRYSTDD